MLAYQNLWASNNLNKDILYMHALKTFYNQLSMVLCHNDCSKNLLRSAFTIAEKCKNEGWVYRIYRESA